MREIMETDHSNTFMRYASDIDNVVKYIIRDCPSDSAFMDRIILLTFLGARKPDLSL